MKHAQYLRERAADFRNMAVTAHNSQVAQSFYQVAIVCEEAADKVERSIDNKCQAAHPLIS